MTALRIRMIEDMQLRGFSERTQEAYVRAVKQLSAHYHKSPDQITEVELALDVAISPRGVNIVAKRNIYYLFPETT